MPINHKFLNKEWNNGYESHNAILDVTMGYKPEVLIIGTYNPNTEGPNNQADFFYSRDNYLFPLLHGIFNLNGPYNQAPPYTNLIWPLCNQLKLSFTDLITVVFPEQDVELIPNTNLVIFEGEEYNLIKDIDLLELDSIHQQIQWNDNNIIDFINHTPTIKFVLLTQKSTNNNFYQRLLNIQLQCNRPDVSFRCIYTPSGQGLPGIPRNLFLSLQWVVQQDQGDRHHGFDLAWLHAHNVHQFKWGNYILNF